MSAEVGQIVGVEDAIDATNVEATTAGWVISVELADGSTRELWMPAGDKPPPKVGALVGLEGAG